MELRFIHFYPDLMSLYGSYANVTVLKRYLERLGNSVTVETVGLGENADLSGADFIYMGAGTERAARAAMENFARFGGAVKALAEDGAAMLFAGTAMELLGERITVADGTVFAGIGLAGFSAVHGERRMVEDVYGRTDLFPEAVVGFMNKCGAVTGVETPLLTSVEERLCLPAYRPAVGEKSEAAGGYGCRCLCPAGGTAPGGAHCGPLGGARLRRDGGRASAQI